jgi:hypothetical protein
MKNGIMSTPESSALFPRIAWNQIGRKYVWASKAPYIKKAIKQDTRTDRCIMMEGGISALFCFHHSQTPKMINVTPKPQMRPMILELSHRSPWVVNSKAKKSMTAAPRNKTFPTRSRPRILLRNGNLCSGIVFCLKKRRQARIVTAPTGRFM